MVAPEFQITNASTIVGISNLIAYALYAEQSVDGPAGFSQIRIDLGDYEALAADPDALLDRIDLVFFAGDMGADIRAIIRDALLPLEADLPARARVALYLALISPAQAISGGS